MNSGRAKLANRPDALCEHLLPEVRNPLETVLQVLLYAGVHFEARRDDHHGMPGKAGDGSDQPAQRRLVVAQVVEDCADFRRHVPVDAVGVGADELRRRKECRLREVAFHVPHSITILALGGRQTNAARGFDLK